MKSFFKDGERPRFSPIAIVGMVVGGLALAVLFAFLFGWVVMLLWNKLMPDIFGLKTITYWQAWGLVILSHILIKPGFGDHGGHEGRGRRGRNGDWKRRLGERCAEEGGAEEGDSKPEEGKADET